MSRKDFVLIAETIRFMNISPEAKQTVINDFADMCAGTNGRFDRDRFINACTKVGK